MAQLDPAILEALAAIVGETRVLTDESSCEQYGLDWTRFYTPAPSAVLLPGSIEEVQAIVRLAADQNLAIVPSGGRTGLSAGAVAANGELVLALDRLNTLSDFNLVDRTVRCGAGVITEQLQQFAEEQGLYYPVDFASAGSSQIGGNISTNAGGIKVIKHGMTRDWVAGLKLVTGTGELLDLNRGLMKNNAGYDLRQLAIGAEGTLGVVVEATMSLTRTPENLAVLVLGAPDMQAIMHVLTAFQAEIELSAFEFFSEIALEKVVAHQDLQRPFETVCDYYALIEFEQPNDAAMEKAMALFEHCVEQGWVYDGTVSQSLSQAQNLWRLREDISETITPWTPYKNDISTVISRVPEFLAEVEAVVNQNYPDFEIVWFGHIGDGNVHLNILKPEGLPIDEFKAQCGEVSTWVFEIVQRYGGSVSAEHGVGLLKKEYLEYSRSALEIEIMKGIKQVFDPKGIMNPGKIFDA
ncbi:FAD-binding oxidoreductase [Halioglobus japonicus]|uniref:D-2-hydroxyglutarate dehydrogenase n=2 Tax=Halioglobus TaxID=1217416 RepID=A0AAP8MCC6_9GAMM|nr:MULTISPECIES: FAD-binding oxidoreductase [Halioglobus]AQA20110.1 FAD-binding oxidoreductase [Halioglobus japonicus]KZX58450.1 FAD-linked oxidase [Halioglobus sp. HI00S01]PLW85211.1 FAD-binding oxidoreductase [Halioglobus japonicus]GHD19639.1 FAD-binding oxidoreductase [Halioglobus japonicus]